MAEHAPRKGRGSSGRVSLAPYHLCVVSVPAAAQLVGRALSTRGREAGSRWPVAVWSPRLRQSTHSSVAAPPRLGAALRATSAGDARARGASRTRDRHTSLNASAGARRQPGERARKRRGKEDDVRYARPPRPPRHDATARRHGATARRCAVPTELPPRPHRSTTKMPSRPRRSLRAEPRARTTSTLISQRELRRRGGLFLGLAVAHHRGCVLLGR